MSKSVATDSRERGSCRAEAPGVSPLQPQAALAGVGSSLPRGMLKTDPCVPRAPRCGLPGAALPRPWVLWGARRRAGLSHLLSSAIPSEWTGRREHPWPRPPALLEVLPASLRIQPQEGGTGVSLDARAGVLLPPRAQSNPVGACAQPGRALGMMAKGPPKDWSLGRGSTWGGRGGRHPQTSLPGPLSLQVPPTPPDVECGEERITGGPW